MKSGIYIIRNTVTDQIYVGSAKHFERRWQKHRSDWKRQVHANNKILKSVNKYGLDAFKFEIVATCPIEYLIKLEQFFINAMSPYFNICKIAGNSLGVTRSAETREKLRIAKTGKKMSEEFCRKRSEIMKGNTNTLGRKPTPEQLQRQIIGQTGLKRQQSTKDAIGRAHKGRKYSPETIERMRSASLDMIYLIQNIATGEVLVYNNLRKFCITNSLKESGLNMTLTGNQGVKQHKGFKMLEKLKVK